MCVCLCPVYLQVFVSVCVHRSCTECFCRNWWCEKNFKYFGIIRLSLQTPQNEFILKLQICSQKESSRYINVRKNVYFKMKARCSGLASADWKRARAPFIDDEPKSQSEAPFKKVQSRLCAGEESPAYVQLFSLLDSTGRRLPLYEDETTVWNSSAQAVAGGRPNEGIWRSRILLAF